ncbi:MAG: CBS domain-containing protein [Bacteroidia bacterium]|jgi:CBS domain-containing protein|nr:CBS domain-containing protein [Bacteroidia bacterium]
MITANQILKTKGNHVISISSQSMVIDALKAMSEKNIGAILVVDNNKLVGIFSERDYSRKIVLMHKSSDNTKICDVMTSDLFTVKPDTKIENCLMIMTDNNIRHLPILEDDKLHGIISIGDIVKHIIEDQKVTIKNLENYITGRQ